MIPLHIAYCGTGKAIVGKLPGTTAVVEQLVKTGRMHNKSFQRKRWGYSGEPVVTKCRLVVKCLRLPKDVKGGD